MTYPEARHIAKGQLALAALAMRELLKTFTAFDSEVFGIKPEDYLKFLDDIRDTEQGVQGIWGHFNRLCQEARRAERKLTYASLTRDPETLNARKSGGKEAQEKPTKKVAIIAGKIKPKK